MKRNSDLETLQYPFVKRTRFIPVFLIPPAVKEQWILFSKRDLEILQYLFVKGTRFIPIFLIPPAVKERWILFWKCAIPILSTGVAFQEDNLESSIQVPLSALPSHYCLQCKDCKYAIFSVISVFRGY